MMRGRSRRRNRPEPGQQPLPGGGEQPSILRSGERRADLDGGRRQRGGGGHQGQGEGKNGPTQSTKHETSSPGLPGRNLYGRGWGSR